MFDKFKNSAISQNQQICITGGNTSQADRSEFKGGDFGVEPKENSVGGEVAIVRTPPISSSLGSGSNSTTF